MKIRLTKSSIWGTFVQSQVRQEGQKKWRVRGLLSPPMTELPSVTSKPWVGITAVSENALALID